uniref:Uncharacterized protein n=1 Tax=Octopus bimaculoides TaxID=37653 RepID=A0A0L8GF72_OCTBM
MVFIGLYKDQLRPLLHHCGASFGCSPPELNTLSFISQQILFSIINFSSNLAYQIQIFHFKSIGQYLYTNVIFFI